MSKLKKSILIFLKMHNYYVSLIIIMMLSFNSSFGLNRFGSSFEISILDTTNSIPGAYADGIHNDTKAIQAAINSAVSAGGGIVHFSNGKYLCGPITLGSNITLQIDSSATILASQRELDYYYPNADTTKPPSALQNFIYAYKAINITITGTGIIDGQGQPWWDSVNAAKAKGLSVLPLRPRLIYINKCQHILIDSISLRNAPMFHISCTYCYDLNVNNIKITAPSNSPNTDGIDPGSCHHVRISYCTVDNGDDNVAVGSSSPDPSWPNASSSDIIISNCTFLHGHGCSIGSYTSGGVDSMLVDSCTFNGTTNGLRIKSARGRGGNIRNVTYKNITMTGVQYPIWIASYYPDIPSPQDPAQTINSTTPYYHDLTIENLTSTNSPSIGYLVGLPEQFLTKIHFHNVSFSAYTGLTVRNADIDTSNIKFTVTSGSGIIFQVNGTLTGINSIDNSIIHNFNLMQNYPNPFNPSTQIKYSIPNRELITIKVFNILGEEIKTLVNEEKNIGEYSTTWNGIDKQGKEVASGIYFYELIAGDQTLIKKMLLLK